MNIVVFWDVNRVFWYAVTKFSEEDPAASIFRKEYSGRRFF
jgi:hypothetical protein